MRKYALALAIGLVLGIGATCLVLVPRERSAVDRARILESVESELRATIDSSRRELDETRDALSRAEVTNRELAERIGQLGGSISSGSAIAGQIASGIDGDIELVASARGSILKAIDRLRQVQE